MKNIILAFCCIVCFHTSAQVITQYKFHIDRAAGILAPDTVVIPINLSSSSRLVYSKLSDNKDTLTECYSLISEDEFTANNHEYRCRNYFSIQKEFTGDQVMTTTKYKSSKLLEIINTDSVAALLPKSKITPIFKPKNGTMEVIDNTYTGTKFNTSTELRPTPFTKKQLRKMYEASRFEWKTRPLFYMGVMATGGGSFSQVIINNALFSNNDNLAVRQRNEHGNFGYTLGLQVGVNWKKDNTIYLEPLIQRQTLVAEGHDIDWKTGAPLTTSSDHVNNFGYFGVGLGYIWAGTSKKTNAVLEARVTQLWLKKGLGNVDPSVTGLRPDKTEIMIGLGFSFHPSFRWEYRLLPCVAYDLNTLNKGDLTTKMGYYGLTLGVSHRSFGRGIHRNNPFLK